MPELKFSDDWLALRAPADAAARADRLVQHLRALPTAADAVLEVLDLGCGTGANLRHLAPLLARTGHLRQHWCCVDQDAALLARLPARTARWAETTDLCCTPRAHGLCLEGAGWRAEVDVQRLDLHAALADLPLPAAGLVTASALLDLVSGPWLQGLLARCRHAGCGLLFALSYDGRCSLSPAHALDAAVIDLVNRHQRTDKGFGPALGPRAADDAAARCRALGWRVEVAPSDWVLGPTDAPMQRALLTGWHQAAAELAAGEGAGPAAGLDAWLTARLAWVDAGTSVLRIGHLDLVALP
ncbi:class I SAM-dependent methyltransferase [uncultured Thiohalocapsa sp.]|uniref:class I SAM-dependent methyltransferase n=1 Tax=uncultured Thiohalocapsa sp. TaxID=768990 RepID=UPI0025D35B7B|nr:class I SAM-dependent methyltransferase [uncultured Thiohalocapsa sp.]